MATRQSIKKWMLANREDYVDPKTGELNMTAIVEAWDAAEGTGEETLIPGHIAWDVALYIS